MRIGLINIFFTLLAVSVFSQTETTYDESYQEKFDQVRFCLGGGRTGEAFVLLQDLYKVDSTNHYTNYLMGICYTEQNIVTPLSVKHLKYASENMMDVYTYIPYTEKRSPVYVWYYLTKAYSQNGMCQEAKEASERFYKAYRREENDYFVVNIKNFLLKCKRNKPYALKKQTDKNLITKEVEYTTTNNLYGVQVGAFKELVPIREEFFNLKNVEAFIDKDNVVRYVVGHFGIKKQAESLLEVIRDLGYKDAFVVDVNQESRFSREVIIVDHISFKAGLQGKVYYSVQIGAFSNTDSIPENLAKLYVKIEDLKEIPDAGLIILTSGHFETYEDAVVHRDKMMKMGIIDAFVVAFNQGRKISLKSAAKYLEKQRHEALEEENKKKIEK